MTTARQFFKGAAVLTLGRMAGMGLSFLRNLVLARTLTKADYGLAAAFSMAVTLLEFAGSMSFGVQMVQSRDGDSEAYQNTSHAFQFLVASCGALLMLALASPMAHAFQVPQLWWAFALLAIIPFSRGIEHLDTYRRQRRMEYLPVVLCEVIPQLVVTILVWPTIAWLGDYRAIIVIMGTKSLLAIGLSHALARRPYRWGWNRSYLAGMLQFGWPLLLNGLLMFGSQQADQMMVGAWYSLSDLADYSLAYSLVSVAGMLFAQVASSLMLPLLSRFQDDPVRFRCYYRNCIELAALMVGIVLAPLMFEGGRLVELIYGEKYHGTGVLVAILGAAFSIRLLRVTPAIAAMARADSRNQLLSNFWRCVGVPLVLIAALTNLPVAWVAACGLVGEVCAAISSVRRLDRIHSVPISTNRNAFGFVAVVLTLVLAYQWLIQHRMGIFVSVALFLVVAILLGVSAFHLFPATIRESKKWFVPFRLRLAKRFSKQTIC